MSIQNSDKSEGFKMTEIGPLPEEWRVVNVVQCCSFGRGTEPGSDAYNREGMGIPFIRVGNIAAQTQELVYTISTNVKTCDVNDILMTLDGSPGVVTKGFKGAYSSGIRKVTPSSPEIYEDYLFFVLQTEIVRHVMEQYTTGVTIKHASKALPHLKIPLPTPSEQKVIAVILSIIQMAIEAQDKIITAARELKKSLMRHLFTYGPVPVSEADKVPLKETEVGLVPEYWGFAKLGEIVRRGGGSIQTGPFGSLLHASDYVSNGIPFVMPKDLSSEGKIIAESTASIGLKDFQRLARYHLEAGDLLVARRGEIGRRGIVTEREAGWVCGSGSLRIRPGSLLHYLFLSQVFESIWVRNWLSSHAIGTTMANLSTQILSNLPLSLPPIHEQQKISQMLSSIDNKIESEENRKSTLQTLFKTMLHHLMTGKLRVKNLEATVS